MSGEPKYWGSWKGRVMKAIVMDRAQTWNDTRDTTGFSSCETTGEIDD